MNTGVYCSSNIPLIKFKVKSPHKSVPISCRKVGDIPSNTNIVDILSTSDKLVDGGDQDELTFDKADDE